MDLEFTHAVGPQTDGLQNHLGNLIDIIYFENPSPEIPSQEGDGKSSFTVYLR